MEYKKKVGSRGKKKADNWLDLELPAGDKCSWWSLDGYDTWEEAESESDSEAEPAEPAGSNSTNDGNREGLHPKPRVMKHMVIVIIIKTMEMESGLPTFPPQLFLYNVHNYANSKSTHFSTLLESIMCQIQVGKHVFHSILIVPSVHLSISSPLSLTHFSASKPENGHTINFAQPNCINFINHHHCCLHHNYRHHLHIQGNKSPRLWNCSTVVASLLCPCLTFGP